MEVLAPDSVFALPTAVHPNVVRQAVLDGFEERFGRPEALFETIEYCLTNDIRMYGGGQGENAVGREHLLALASLFYAETPNDIAPSGYNDPGIDGELPPSPLSPPSNARGLEW